MRSAAGFFSNIQATKVMQLICYGKRQDLAEAHLRIENGILGRQPKLKMSQSTVPCLFDMSQRTVPCLSE